MFANTSRSRGGGGKKFENSKKAKHPEEGIILLFEKFFKTISVWLAFSCVVGIRDTLLRVFHSDDEKS